MMTTKIGDKSWNKSAWANVPDCIVCGRLGFAFYA